MRAGRELDALVAEKVMGMVDNRPSGRSGEMWGIMDWYAPGEPVWVGDFPLYSTDISAAWEVVEKMREKGFYLDTNNRQPEGYWCEFADEGYEVGGQAFGESEPHAICLASLRALGVEVGE